MDNTISQKQQDLVLVATLLSYDVVFELGKKRSKQGWSAETDLRKCLPVSLDDGFDTSDVRVTRVTIHGEAVTDTVYAEVAGNTSKTEDREAPVIIVGLYNGTDILESGLVLVVTSHVMQ